MGLLFRVFSYRPRLFFLAASLFLSLVCLTPLTASDDTLMAYAVLKDYEFPVGLLPNGVLRYDLDKTTGKFSAYLNGSCSFSLEGSYLLDYKSTIKGYISKGKLNKLQGISVKVFLFWFNIVEVIRRGDELEFSVGIASAGFPVDNFEECPQCGCGMDCLNRQVRRIRTNPFASSSS